MSFLLGGQFGPAEGGQFRPAKTGFFKRLFQLSSQDPMPHCLAKNWELNLPGDT